MLKRMKIDKPTQQQKKEAEKMAIEEHHTILVLFGADKYKNGKLIEDSKNVVLRKNIIFQKLSQKHALSKWNAKNCHKVCLI